MKSKLIRSASLRKVTRAPVGGPQVPLPGHGDEIENPNWASRDYMA